MARVHCTGLDMAENPLCGRLHVLRSKSITVSNAIQIIIWKHGSRLDQKYGNEARCVPTEGK
jgi:hypothetical protein